MEKNAKIVPFFYKERIRTQRSFRSFEKNGCPILLKAIVSLKVAGLSKVILDLPRLALIFKMFKYLIWTARVYSSELNDLAEENIRPVYRKL